MWDTAIANLVAHWLDQAMHEKRMRKADLARITGIDRSMLDRYIKGRSIPSDESIEAMARALETAPPHPCDLMSELNVEFPTYSKGLVDAAKRLKLTIHELLRLAADESITFETILADVESARTTGRESGGGGYQRRF